MSFDTDHSGSSYRLYVQRPTSQILYFFTEMEHNDAQSTCQDYGGRLYLPRSLSDINMLLSREMDGFIGLDKLTGVWLDSKGQAFTDTSLLISGFPVVVDGTCARVRDGYIADCTCTRARKFVCHLEY